MYISAEDFIKIWQMATSIDEVIKRTKLSRASVIGRANRFRKRNIPMKKFKTGKKTNDWDALAKLAEGLIPKKSTKKP